jgi:hypothetical protein
MASSPSHRPISPLKAYKGFPHGMPTTQTDTLNADLLAFIKGGGFSAPAEGRFRRAYTG